MQSKNSLNLITFSIFSVSLLLFLFGIKYQDLNGEAVRFYLSASEMAHGLQFFPTIFMQRIADYPATFVWLIAILSAFYGKLTPFVTMLPSAIAASLTLVYTYLIGETYKKYCGWYAICYLLLTWIFVKSSLTTNIEIFTTFFTTLCFYLIYKTDLKHESYQAAVIYPFIILSYLFSGTIGLLIPASVVCSYLLLEKNYKQAVFVFTFSFLLLIICNLIVLCIASNIGDDAFIQQVLHSQIMGGFANPIPTIHDYKNYLWDYLLVLPVALLTLLGMFYFNFVSISFYRAIKFQLKLCAWIAVIFIGVFVLKEKSAVYFLPCAPALALLAAFVFSAKDINLYFKVLRYINIFVLLLTPTILLVGLAIFYRAYPQYSALWSFKYSFMLLMFLQNTTASCYYFLKKQIDWQQLLIFAGAILGFFWVLFFVLQPINNHQLNISDIVSSVEKVRSQTYSQLIFFNAQRKISLQYYFHMQTKEVPIFIYQLPDLANYKSQAIVITSQSTFDKLPKQLVANYHVLLQTNLLNEPSVIFINR